MSDLQIDATETVRMVNGSGEHKSVLSLTPIPLTANAKHRFQPISEERAKPIIDRLNGEHESIKQRLAAGELTEDAAKRERDACNEIAVAEKDAIEAACEDPDRPIYLIRTPTKQAKIEWRCGIMRHARPVGQVDHLREMRKALVAKLPEDSAGVALAVIDQWEELQKNELGNLLIETPDIVALKADYETLRNSCWDNVAECASVIANQVKWSQWSEYEAVRHFLAGWERIPATFEERDRLCTEATLEHIPDAHMKAIANRASALISLSESQRKN